MVGRKSTRIMFEDVKYNKHGYPRKAHRFGYIKKGKLRRGKFVGD